jgi:hypothetical protein
MEYVLLTLALPLFFVALGVTFRRRRRPPAPAAPAAAAAPPVSAPVAAPWLVRRLLPWLFVLGIFTGAFLFFSPDSFMGNLLRLVTLSRYGLLTGLLLVGLVPLGLQAAPSLLGNLFVLRAPRHLFHVAWMSVLVGTMAVVVCGVEELNAPARYGTQPLNAAPGPWGLTRVAAVLVLCLPVLLACARCSREAFLPAGGWRWGPWVAGGLAGLAAGFLLIVLVAAVQPAFLSPGVSAPDFFPLQPLGEWAWQQLGSPRSEALFRAGDALARLVEARGYTAPGEDGRPRLAPGHAQLMAGMGAVLLVYLGHYLLVKALGVRAACGTQVPPLYLVLLLLLLLGFFLQGLAFALDLYWVPASLAVVLFAFVLYQFSNTDHLFSVGRTKAAGGVQAAAGTAPAAPEWGDVAAAWKRQPQRTLVAVTASGGGIQAAAWTARALVGLHELYGDPFTRSIRLLSAVSGGSVGALYCLDAWPPGNPVLPGAAWQYPAAAALPPANSVCGRAMASSLEATAWGLVFPDLLRVLAPVLVAKTDDRGARVEEAWRERMLRPEARMTDWVGPILRGEMPVPVFNATIVETGQRFLASPVGGRPRPNLPPAARPRHLFELYPGAAPLVSTMVRLSATFPFVSPICRPAWSPGDPWPESDSYHFADGGYVDNEGMVTVIEWLLDLLDPAYVGEPPFDRVLLVRLMPFPSSGAAGASLGRGWFYSTFGPIDAIQNVRTASQQERNELAVSLFTEAAARRGVEVRSAVLRFELPSALDPPLSWMLTDPQKAAVGQAWLRLADPQNPASPLGEIDAWFARASPAPAAAGAAAGT